MNKRTAAVRHTKQVLACFLAVLTIFLSLPFVASATGGVTDTSVVSTSFYKLASAASGYLSDSLAQDNTAPAVGSGAAGGLLGYCDEADTSDTILDWVFSSLSTSSATYSYDTLKKAGNSYYQYGNYGRLLNSIGFDKTGTEATSISRYIMGGPIYLVYLLATFTDSLLGMAVELLRQTNPFQLFQTSAGSGNAWIAGASGALTNTNLAATVTDLYHSIVNDLAWTIIIPFLVIGLIISLLLTKADKRFTLKKFLMRLAFMFFLVPVMGGIYTTILNSLDFGAVTADGGNGPVNRTVLSTFVNFEAWARERHLGIDGMGIPNFALRTDSNGDIIGPTNGTMTYIQRNAYRINNAVMFGGVLGDASGVASGGMDWNTDLSDNQSDVANNDQVYTVTDMLNKYMTGAFYQPGQVETDWKEAITYGDTGTMIQDTDGILDWKDGTSDGYLTGAMDSRALWYDAAHSSIGDGGGGTNFASGTTGMSYMALYNYMSSRFTDTGVTVYSSEDASSGFVRQSHYAVSMVGTGLTQILVWLNTLTILGAYVVMALCYAFGMIMSNIRRTISVIASLPMAALGSLRFAAKSIAYVLMMIVEIVVSMLVYQVATELLFSINNLFLDLLGPVINSAGASESGTILYTASAGTAGAPAALFVGQSLLIVQLLMSTIFYVLMLIVMIRFRKTIVKSVDEAVAAVVNRLIPESDVTPDDGRRGGGGVIAGAAGAMAGQAVAQRMAQSNTDKNGSNTSVPGESSSSESSETNSETTQGAAAGDQSQVEGSEQLSIEDHEMDPGSGSSGGGEGGDTVNTFDESDRADSEAGEKAAQAESLASGSSMEEESAEEAAAREAAADGDVTEGSGAPGSQQAETPDERSGDYEENGAAQGDIADGGSTGDAAGAVTAGAAGAATGAAAGTAAGRSVKAGEDAKNGSGGSNASHERAKNAANAYQQSEAQKKALEKAAGISGGDAQKAAGGSDSAVTGEAAIADGYESAAAQGGTAPAADDNGHAQNVQERMDDTDTAVKEAQSAAQDAVNGSLSSEEAADVSGQAKAQSASVQQGMQAARDGKGAPLTPEEKTAARVGASTVANNPEKAVQRAAGHAARKEKGRPLSASQKEAVAARTAAMMKQASSGADSVKGAGESAVAAAKAHADANGYSLSSAEENAIRSGAEANASATAAVGSVANTTKEAARLGASFANGHAPLSAKQVQQAEQTANTVLAEAAQATSTQGMAMSAGMSAAGSVTGKDSSGARIPLSAAQRQAVSSAVNTAVSGVENAALAGAATAKGAPLTAAEAQAVRANVKEQAVQQAAVSAMEAVGGKPLGADARKAVARNASRQMASIQAANSQVALADRAARQTAALIQQSNKGKPLGRRSYTAMRGQARSMTEQAAAAATPQALAGAAAASGAAKAANMHQQSFTESDRQSAIRTGTSAAVQMANNASPAAMSRRAGAEAAAFVAENRAHDNGRTLSATERSEAASRGARSGAMSHAVSERGTIYASSTTGQSGTAAVAAKAPVQRGGLSRADARQAILLAGIGGALSGSGSSVLQGAGSAMTMNAANRAMQNGRNDDALVGRLEGAIRRNGAQIEALKNYMKQSGHSDEEIQKILREATAESRDGGSKASDGKGREKKKSRSEILKETRQAQREAQHSSRRQTRRMLTNAGEPKD